MESEHRPILFYKRSCPPCQWMSRLAAVLSFGVIRRCPLESAEAREFYRKFPKHEGQLVLLVSGRPVFGRMVFAALPLAVLVAWGGDARRLLARSFGFAPRHETRRARVDGRERVS